MWTIILSLLGKVNKGWLAAGLGGVLILGLAGIGWWRIESLAADNERLEAQAEALEADNARLSGELQNNLAALAEREDARLRLADETNELKFKLGEIYEKDTLAADWSVADMPDGIVECLLQTLPTADPARIAACGLASGSARTAPGGPKQ